MVVSGRSVNLTTLFLDRLRPPKRLTSSGGPLSLLMVQTCGRNDLTYSYFLQIPKYIHIHTFVCKSTSYYMDFMGFHIFHNGAGINYLALMGVSGLCKLMQIAHQSALGVKTMNQMQ